MSQPPPPHDDGPPPPDETPGDSAVPPEQTPQGQSPYPGFGPPGEPGYGYQPPPYGTAGQPGPGQASPYGSSGQPGPGYEPSPYGYQPAPYGPPRTGRSNKAKFWIGAALSIPALVVLTMAFGLVGGLASYGGDIVSSVVPGGLTLLVLAGVVVGIVVERTRWYALGMLAGIALAAILFAGACVILLATAFGGY